MKQITVADSLALPHMTVDSSGVVRWQGLKNGRFSDMIWREILSSAVASASASMFRFGVELTGSVI